MQDLTGASLEVVDIISIHFLLIGLRHMASLNIRGGWEVYLAAQPGIRGGMWLKSCQPP